MNILERGPQLEQLHRFARQAATGQGLLVFVGGEMGIGKSTLVETLRTQTGSATQMTIVSWDGLPTHGALGPLFDKALSLGPEVLRLLETGAPRDQVFRSVETALRRARELTILVGEDAHWADEASLELIRFLGRRIGDLPTLFIATYRDDELPPEHPLRRVMGDLATAAAVRRMTLPPLSIEAVTTLAAGSGMDPVTLRDYTAGNPFFVIEILNARTEHPITIQDAILARTSRISAMARAVLDTAAIVGLMFDPVLLGTVVCEPIEAALEECLGVGLLKPAERGLRFRHSAVRDAILQTISPVRKQVLHRRVYQCLRDDPTYEQDHARLAYHADEAAERDDAFTHAIAAARQAAAYKSHREAAAQYARAVRNVAGKDPDTRASLLEAGAYEDYLTGRIEEAIAAQHQVVELREATNDALRLGESVRILSRFCWFGGHTAQATAFAERALAILEPFPRSREMARACSTLSQLRMLADDTDEALRWGNRAIALAETLGDASILSHALNNVGTTMARRGGEEGIALMQRALQLARDEHLEDDVTRALTNLAWTEWGLYHLGAARHYIDEGLAYSDDHDLPAMHLYMRSIQAHLHLAACDWDRAYEVATLTVQHPLAIVNTKIVALTALGLCRIRQGDVTGTELDEALALAEQTGELQRLGPVHAARAEAAWLQGNLETTAAEAAAAIDLACQKQNWWLAGELALWLHRAGTPPPSTGVCIVAEPYLLEIDGDWRAAANIWCEKGVSLNEHRARAASTDETELRSALLTFDRIGARLDAVRVAERLRSLGYRNIPRGPRSATRSNYALLTAREIDVLQLLARGSTNREIAERLYVSRKTVEHHVSAILAKLDVPTRGSAVARAREAGVLQG